jgi:hypothetical protein
MPPDPMDPSRLAAPVLNTINILLTQAMDNVNIKFSRLAEFIYLYLLNNYFFAV